ncbi:hypothetical protein WBP07_21360 (plasmid) [Novosphingobium sp. BL-8A]|uniref:hypothetical protein n=1 Tax=Novosphingobium sp. BL-8A TaxID=3127639 RepID=UPI003756E689
MPMEIAIPRRDLERLQRFATRELPKAASNAVMTDRVLRALYSTLYPRDQTE